MKRLVEEVEGDGLQGMIGERVTLWCLNYIYTGKLTGINAECVRLDDAGIVYETGELNTKEWKDMQKLPKPCYVMKRCIESFMILK